MGKYSVILIGVLLTQATAGLPTADDLRTDVGIIGGETLDIKDAPYQVALNRHGKHHCGGVIINDTIILTAAHCLKRYDESSITIRVGSSYSTKGGKVYKIREVIIHPEYGVEKRNNNDIAVVKVKKMKFSNSVRPISMVEKDEEISEGSYVLVSGWGRMEGGIRATELQGVSIPIMSEQSCKKIFHITPSMFCVGNLNGKQNACKGDSGGPLAYNGKLAGIGSFKKGDGCIGTPVVYSKIAALRKWVESVM